MDCDGATPTSSIKRLGEEPSSPPQSKKWHVQTLGNKRASIVFKHVDNNVGMKYKVEYSISIVNIDSHCSADHQGFIPITPTLHYISEFGEDPVAHDAFLVLGETLYIFEGSIGDSCKKSIFTFDLSSLNLHSTPLMLDKTNLVKIGEMGYPKAGPVVIPTPDDQKIVVLPSDKYPFRGCDTIELYDLVGQIWEQLPPLQIKGWAWAKVEACGFINESTLLIQIKRAGMYALDLAASNKQWVHVDRISCDAWRIPSYCGAFNFRLIEDRFCISDTAAFDLQEFSDHCFDELSCDGGFSWPFVGLPTKFGPHPYHPIATEVVLNGMIAFLSYDQQLGVVDYCQLRVERLRFVPQNDCRIIIDVCRSDLNTYLDDYKEKKKSLPSEAPSITDQLMKTTIVKSFKFSITFGKQNCQLFPPCSFFCF